MPKGISVWMISFQMIRQGFEDEFNSNIHRLCHQPRRVVKGMELAQVWAACRKGKTNSDPSEY